MGLTGDKGRTLGRRSGLGAGDRPVSDVLSAHIPDDWYATAFGAAGAAMAWMVALASVRLVVFLLCRVCLGYP